MATPRNSGRVLIAGTLDTKGEELAFLRDFLAAPGVPTLVVDLAVLGDATFAADISRDEIARAAGESAEELRKAGDRGRAVAAMHWGFAAWCRSHAANLPGPSGGRHRHRRIRGYVRGRSDAAMVKTQQTSVSQVVDQQRIHTLLNSYNVFNGNGNFAFNSRSTGDSLADFKSIS